MIHRGPNDPSDPYWLALIAFVWLWACYDTTVTRLHEWRQRRMSKPNYLIIGIMPKTMLRVIVRREQSWQIWTGVNDMQQPYHKWTGTMIECFDNGTAQRVVINPDGTEDTLRIM